MKPASDISAIARSYSRTAKRVVGQAVGDRRVVAKKAGDLARLSEHSDGAVDQMASFGKHHAAAIFRQVPAFVRADQLIDRRAKAIDAAQPSVARGFHRGLHRGMITPLIAHLHDALALGRLRQQLAKPLQVGAGRLIEMDELSGVYELLGVVEIAVDVGGSRSPPSRSMNRPSICSSEACDVRSHRLPLAHWGRDGKRRRIRTPACSAARESCSLHDRGPYQSRLRESSRVRRQKPAPPQARKCSASQRLTPDCGACTWMTRCLSRRGGHFQFGRTGDKHGIFLTCRVGAALVLDLDRALPNEQKLFTAGALLWP